MAVLLRRKVSLNKKRYQKDGFDLDLTYINKQIIAMGFPAIGIESIFRNPREQVKKLLDTYHAGKYKLYNLCVESNRQYEDHEFEHRVGRFPFGDHQAPPVELMGKFCSDVHEWTQTHEKNVAAIHCKAGKGRAGMMICCYLLHSGIAENADEAMQKYAKARTHNNEGVTIPSQQRYIRYYDQILRYGLPKQPKVVLQAIKVKTSYASAKRTELFVEVFVRKDPMGPEEFVFRSHPKVEKAGGLLTITMKQEVKGDVKILFFDKNVAKKKAMCHCWFNTGFVDDNKLQLKKSELDGAWKDKKNKKLGADFEVEIDFDGAEISAMSKLKKKAKKKAKKAKSEEPIVVEEPASSSDSEEKKTKKKSKKSKKSKKEAKAEESD